MAQKKRQMTVSHTNFVSVFTGCNLVEWIHVYFLFTACIQLFHRLNSVIIRAINDCFVFLL